MTSEQRNKLWNLINKYTKTCGGNPCKNIYGNVSRQKLVCEIEDLLYTIEFEAELKGKIGPEYRDYQDS
jgi:hypothetical protein